jgi:hypothetical protein
LSIDGLAALKLNKDGAQALEQMRAATEPTKLATAEPKAADELVENLAGPMLGAAGLPLPVVNQYRWFLREVARLMRTRTGPELAFYCELTIRKWLRYGLEPNTMQLLLSEVWKRVRAGVQ